MPRRPRLFEPNIVYDATVQTVDRQFLLKPTPEVTNIVGACLGRAQRAFPVVMHYALANVNHPHLGVSAPEERLRHIEPFFNLSQSLLARELNRHWHRKGPLWMSRIHISPCVSDDKAEERLDYAMTNPVKDGLVDQLSRYPGFSTYRELARGEAQRYFYFDRTAWWRQGGPSGRRRLEEFIEWVSLEVSPLPHLQGLTLPQCQSRFRHRLRELEERFREARREAERTVFGVKNLRQLDHRQRPRSDHRRDVQPLCHASTVEDAVEYEVRYRQTQRVRMAASLAFRQGRFDVEFPPGTFPPPLKTMYYASLL